MNKTLKIFLIFVMAIMISMTTTTVFANTTLDAANIIEGVAITAPDATTTGGLMNVINRIMGFIQWAAIIGGTIIIAILGVKYMMGSLEEKAEYKKSMIPLIVGIVVVMGATSIAKLLFNTFVMR